LTDVERLEWQKIRNYVVHNMGYIKIDILGCYAKVINSMCNANKANVAIMTEFDNITLTNINFEAVVAKINEYV
jgi:hypothetical protein